MTQWKSAIFDVELTVEGCVFISFLKKQQIANIFFFFILRKITARVEGSLMSFHGKRSKKKAVKIFKEKWKFSDHLVSFLCIF